MLKLPAFHSNALARKTPRENSDPRAPTWRELQARSDNPRVRTAHGPPGCEKQRANWVLGHDGRRALPPKTFLSQSIRELRPLNMSLRREVALLAGSGFRAQEQMPVAFRFAPLGTPAQTEPPECFCFAVPGRLLPASDAKGLEVARTRHRRILFRGCPVFSQPGICPFPTLAPSRVMRPPGLLE